jgi:hypothetical protein
VRLGRLAIPGFDRCYSSAWQAKVGGSHTLDHVREFQGVANRSGK